MIDGFEDNVSLHTQRDNILKNKDKIIIAKKSGMIIFIDHLDLAILEVLVFFNQIQDISYFTQAIFCIPVVCSKTALT